MKVLKELVDIVTRQRVEKAGLTDLMSIEDEASQYAKFYNAIRTQAINSDTEAAKYFYSSTTTDDRYRQLKSRFKKRLFSYLFFLDINKNVTSHYVGAYLTCLKSLVLCKILQANGARYSFEKLANQTLTTASKFYLHGVLVPIINDLLTHYSLLGKQREYKKLLKGFMISKKYLDAEFESERLFENVVINFATSNLVTKELEEQANIHTRRLKEIAQEFPNSFRIQFLRYFTHAIYYQVARDYKALVQTCNDAEIYIEKHPIFYQTSPLAQFSLMKMAALLNLRDHTNGLKSVRRSLNYFEEGRNNWLLTMETYFLLAMQAGKYNLSSEIFLTAVNHSKFKYASEIRQEKWRIFHAYLHYIYEVENLDKRLLKNKYLPNFNITSFFNNTLHSSKDKTGFNISILALQIQYLLKDHKVDDVFDRMDALNIYAYRYLNKKENTRAYTYIKMLQTAEKKSFIFQYVSVETKKMHEQLRTVTDSFSAEWEILPYDVMWDHALQFMEKADASTHVR